MCNSGIKKVVVITSCTGEKLVHHEHALTLSDFRKGSHHVMQREQELSGFLTPSEDLYTGQQHIRLMRGIRKFRQSCGSDKLDLWILSAGYGLIPGNRLIAPYECTFNDMKKAELRKWADTLRIPLATRSALATPSDLTLVLLGDRYLRACSFDDSILLGGPTLIFCGGESLRHLPNLPDLRSIVLTNKETKSFSCGLIALKGEIGARIIENITDGGQSVEKYADSDSNILNLLQSPVSSKAPVKKKVVSNPAVDKVIRIPESWWKRHRQGKFRYFIPEWDDTVDPDYDFMNDAHASGGTDWSNEVYAHQLYQEPNYDGILISKIVAEKTAKKKQKINELGVHRYLRVPPEYPIMGDCGAFGYIMEDKPPYSTDEILDYYTRLGFNYGVSIDHLIVSATEDQKKFRYDVTIHNALDFIAEHKKRGLPWEPVGAVQGWDPESYAEAARQYVAMGYRYIGLGGLVRSSTSEILRILEKVHQVVPPTVRVHLFGIARYRALREFIRLGVYSIDSASVLRSAWLGADRNFLMMDGWYSAIRVPPANGFRAKRLIASGKMSKDKLSELERDCLVGLRELAQRKEGPSGSLLDRLVEYDESVAGVRKRTRERIERTLTERPWSKCSCEVCKKSGIEVAIFRGNNRNRRRGFHNTYVFYRLVDRLIAGERIPWLHEEGQSQLHDQMTLFSTQQ